MSFQEILDEAVFVRPVVSRDPRWRQTALALKRSSGRDSSREVVLIGKPGTGKAVPFCRRSDARPIDVRGQRSVNISGASLF